MLREARYYSRLALALAKWSRTPLERDPEALVAQTVRARADNFLALARTAIFETPTNPYNALFRWSGCEYGDLARMVRGEGLDGALRALAKAGVYLTHDEFKGRTPVVRGGEQLVVVDSADLRNPTYKGVIETSSSGSRSRGTTTQRSLEYQIYREAQERVLMAQHMEGSRELAVMGAILPSSGGLRRAMNCGLRRDPPGKWFAVDGRFRASGHYQLMTRLLLLEMRALGVPAVFPEFLPHNDFRPVARWIAKRKREGVPQLVAAGVSRGVRVAAAAMDENLDIAGTRFLMGGEALTDAKRAVVESAGCEAHARYMISELGAIGMGCREMQGNCVHICLDSVAVISRAKVAPLSDVTVQSLLFTSLLPFAATVVVNVEMDDAGTLGPARCNCPLHKLGLTQQVDGIFSYGKLTGQGTTLLGSDLLRILECDLPSRFGGVPSDFQLVEREGHTQTEVELRVHPRLGLGSAAEVENYFLSQVKALWAGGSARRVWMQTQGLRVVFAEPFSSGDRGKVHALHLLGTSGNACKESNEKGRHVNQ